jgi:hypothetical protein
MNLNYEKAQDVVAKAARDFYWATRLKHGVEDARYQLFENVEWLLLCEGCDLSSVGHFTQVGEEALREANREAMLAHVKREGEREDDIPFGDDIPW